MISKDFSVGWIKKKQIFEARNDTPLMASYAQIPVPLRLSEDIYRIYFSTRDPSGKAYPYYLDYNFSNDEIIHLEKAPLLELGAPGTFDDSGIMPSSALHYGDKIYLYYIAWNVRQSVPYHLSIGLAVSKDNGKTFAKYSEGPVMDRAVDEPFFNTAPCVIPDKDALRMWYISTTGWKDINGVMEPQYLVRSARSQDGVHWVRQEEPAINYAFEGEAIGRPWVIQNEAGFRMWYSKRGLLDYRQVGGQHYTIGYAESKDGEIWSRKDEVVGIDLSAQGWDSEMMEYCSVIKIGEREIMLYNGNKFGATGFGYAERKA